MQNCSHGGADCWLLWSVAVEGIQALIVNDSGLGGTLTMEWRKAIPEARDRLQSRVLVWVVGTVLAAPCLWLLIRLVVLVAGIGVARRYHAYPHQNWLAIMPWVVSLTFAAAVWVLRAATPMAAVCGGMVCLLVTWSTISSPNPLHSGLAPLMALFVTTFLATRAGKRRKTESGLAESASGRNAAQVLANLGAAALVVLMCRAGWFDWASQGVDPFASYGIVLPVLLMASLCEATSDTVSSEIGQAFGGTPFLLTTFGRVAPGTDGALSLLGTAAGVVAAAMIAAVGMVAMRMSVAHTAIALTGGLAGLLFDSLLGATAEPKGWLGNDLVNFSSTVFAVLVALGLLAWRG